MILHFYEPPVEQRTGGLEAAIRSLEAYLVNAGITVRVNSPTNALARCNEPVIVHFHGLWQTNFPRISAVCSQQGIPYVVSPHGMLEPWAWRHKWWKKWPYFYARERGHLARSQALVATGPAEARHLAKVFPRSHCAVLPLGVLSAHRPDQTTARQSLGWKEEESVLLYLSRIHPKKGLHLLLHALVKLGREMPMSNVRLVIVGEGDARYTDQVTKLVASQRAHLPAVDWVGGVWGDARWAYFQGADLFCLPSFSENFGLAVLEALQVGTRVLTTPHTPWLDLVSWRAGWLLIFS